MINVLVETKKIILYMKYCTKDNTYKSSMNKHLMKGNTDITVKRLMYHT